MKRNKISINEADPTPLELSRNFIFSQCDSMKSISECTMASQISIAEKPHETQNLYSSIVFENRSHGSTYSQSQCNPNTKKDKFLVVQSRLVECKDNTQSDDQANALLEIERRTEIIVNKQRKQRKQLSKLKQLYKIKEEEAQRYRVKITTEMQLLQSQIDSLKDQRVSLTKERQIIKRNIDSLSLQKQKTQLQMKECIVQKEELINQIQLLQINFEKPISFQVPEQKTVQDLDRQIRILNGLITTKQNQVGYQAQLVKLLQIKIRYVQQRQRLKAKLQIYKCQHKITKLNQSILSRNSLIKMKNKNIQELSQSNCTKEQQQKQFLMETSDTFFQSNSQSQQSKLTQSQMFRDEIREIIHSYYISGHEESYQAIENIVLGMSQNYPISKQDFFNLLDIALYNLSNKLVYKAKQKLDKITGIDWKSLHQ